MSCFFLKQLDPNTEQDKPVLDVFEHCREHVLRVASTALLPNHIVVTTQNGFIELVDISSGEFRLFLTHLDRHIPLDSPVRCVALLFNCFSSPCPALLGTSHFLNGVPHLLYSLAFSNELLFANLETGVVSGLAKFNTRPSALFCDRDYVACGEGGGEVSVWSLRQGISTQRGACEHLKLIWKQMLLEDTVVCLRVEHERLICCSADHRFCILLVETGQCLKTLVGEPEPTVDALLFENFLTYQSSAAVFSSTCIAVYTESTGTLSNASDGEDAMQEHLSEWRLAKRFPLDVTIQCASCFGKYLVAGTASGVVLLYFCENTSSFLRELIRLDVSQSVMTVQIYPDETLLVVTSTGDIWKWPLKDLVSQDEEKKRTNHHMTLSKNAQEELVKAVNPPNEPNSLLTNESQYSLSECAETVAGEGDRASSQARLTEDRVPEGAHAGEEGEQQEETALFRTVRESISTMELEASSAQEGSEKTFERAVSEEACPLLGMQSRATSGLAGDVKTDPHLSEAFQRTTPTNVQCETLAQRKRHHGKDSITSIENLPRSGWQSTDGTRVVEGDDKYSENTTAVDTSSASSSDSVCRDDHTASDYSTLASDATESEPEVVAVEEQHSLNGSTDSVSSSLRPRSAEPPKPIVGEKNVSTGHAASVYLSLRSKADVLLSDRTRRPKVKLGDHRHGNCVDSPQRHPAVCVVSRSASAELRTPRPDVDQLRKFKTMLGPLPAIAALRKGRRLDPRQIEQILKVESVNKASESVSGSAGGEVKLQSTAMLLEQKEALGQLTFGFQSYVKEHPFEAQALHYHFPVRLPTYALEDRVFGEDIPLILEHGISPRLRIQNNTSTGNAGAQELVTNSQASVKVSTGGGQILDDLMDVTHERFTRKRDSELIAERRRGGPSINDHHCEDLLYPTAADPSSTVLFKEYYAQPPEPAALLLPIPLPPTPTVF